MSFGLVILRAGISYNSIFFSNWLSFATIRDGDLKFGDIDLLGKLDSGMCIWDFIKLDKLILNILERGIFLSEFEKIVLATLFGMFAGKGSMERPSTIDFEDELEEDIIWSSGLRHLNMLDFSSFISSLSALFGSSLFFFLVGDS